MGSMRRHVASDIDCPQRQRWKVGLLAAFAWIITLGNVRAQTATPIYNPIFENAALSRVGATNRSAFGVIDLMVFAPTTKGASTTNQPTLYWYQSEAQDQPYVFVIQVVFADEPLFEIQLEEEFDDGINAISLVDLGVQLAAGIEYEWSVAVIVDADNRAHDIFSMGSVQYMVPDEILRTQLDAATVSDRVQLLLQNGYWYDAIDLLQTATASGTEPVLNDWLDELLRSQKLNADVRILATELAP